MKIPFHKYQGTGNDFIMIDNRDLFFDRNDTSLIAQMCHRRFGIGADGLILLENMENYDFNMVYFNANGSEGSLCGNGGRCTVKFAHTLGLFESKTKFMAVDGEHIAYINNNWIYLKMHDVAEIESNQFFYFLNTGSPHYVEFVRNLENFEVFQKGKSIRYNERFAKEGTNVNFVEQVGDNELFVRTYERGVEDETYSCGTGVTAAALTATLQGMKSPINIRTLGGSLQISFEQKDNKYQEIYLAGPATSVFEGFFEV